jgi:hypothetical protein
VPGGRPASCTGRLADCPDFLANCKPGDVSAFSFGVEALSISSSSVNDGDTNVPLNQPLYFTSNVPLAQSSLANITVTPAPPGGFTPSDMGTQIELMFGAGLAPSTMYTITFPTTVTDTFGQGLPQPLVIHFTTAAM